MMEVGDAADTLSRWSERCLLKSHHGRAAICVYKGCSAVETAARKDKYVVQHFLGLRNAVCQSQAQDLANDWHAASASARERILLCGFVPR